MPSRRTNGNAGGLLAMAPAWVPPSVAKAAKEQRAREELMSKVEAMKDGVAEDLRSGQYTLDELVQKYDDPEVVALRQQGKMEAMNDYMAEKLRSYQHATKKELSRKYKDPEVVALRLAQLEHYIEELRSRGVRLHFDGQWHVAIDPHGYLRERWKNLKRRKRRQ